MIHRIWKAWDTFWFSPLDLYNVSLMRFLISWVWLVMYGVRFSYFDIFYSETGILPVEKAPLFLPEILQSPFPFYFTSEALVYTSHWLYLLLLLGLGLGLFSRSLTWLVFFLHVGLLQRNPGLTYGADLFTTFWLLGLCFVEHNRYFSVWNWIKKKEPKDSINLPQMNSDWLSTAGVRLIQVQLCFVYAFTGIEKLKGVTWWDGTAIWHVVNMRDLLPGDYTFLYHVPLLVAFLTMTTIIFEVYFPCAMLSRAVRPFWLALGVIFHTSIAILIDIPYFGLVMMLPYLLFLDSKTLRFTVHRLRSKLGPKWLPI